MASCHLKLPLCKIPLSAKFNEVLDIKKKQLFRTLITCQMWLPQTWIDTSSPNHITFPHVLVMLLFPKKMVSFVKQNATIAGDWSCSYEGMSGIKLTKLEAILLKPRYGKPFGWVPRHYRFISNLIIKECIQSQEQAAEGQLQFQV